MKDKPIFMQGGFNYIWSMIVTAGLIVCLLIIFSFPYNEECIKSHELVISDFYLQKGHTYNLNANITDWNIKGYIAPRTGAVNHHIFNSITEVVCDQYILVRNATKGGKGE